MLTRLGLEQTRRLISTATPAVNSIMSEGISKHLVLPKGAGFGIQNGALDKDAFKKVLPVLAAKVSPEKAGVLLKAPVLKRHVYTACCGSCSAVVTARTQVAHRCAQSQECRAGRGSRKAGVAEIFGPRCFPFVRLLAMASN